MIRKFSIGIDESIISDMKKRLGNTRLFENVKDADWAEGMPVSELKELINYWRDKYDWRAQEVRLNRLPQYICTLDCGQEIHFVHIKGRGDACQPLLITHGWPGSFIEMEAIIPLLTDPAAHGADELDAFDVIIPSLPGYGFSPAPEKSGTGLYEIAGMLAELMEKLGYNRFFAQGGDWGAHVTSWLARRFPERVKAIHLNFLPGSYEPYIGSDAPVTSEEQTFLDRQEEWYNREGGYDLIQATRPATLAYGLNDSPAGLAAWIYEKFHLWSDWRRSYGGTLNRDSILTNISIYWFTGSIYSSVRLYLESEKRPLSLEKNERISPPAGMVLLPAEMPMPPRSWVERGYNLVYWGHLQAGGHFAALEQPEQLAADIRKFFRRFR